jgi:hypothetical protein
LNLQNPSEGYLTTSTPLDIFYHDVSPLKAAEAVKELKPMSANALFTPTETSAAWADSSFQDRRAYVRCADDRTIPSFAQDGMLAGTGVEWDVHSFETNHSPFLSQPKKLADTIVGLANKWSELS